MLCSAFELLVVENKDRLDAELGKLTPPVGHNDLRTDDRNRYLHLPRHRARHDRLAGTGQAGVQRAVVLVERGAQEVN
jgi:hypothetical protein